MQDAFKGTEQFAIEEEEREAERQRYRAKLSEIEQYINGLLKEGTKESRWKLHDLFLDKTFLEHYKQIDEIAIMYIVMQIYEKEQEAGIEETILEQGSTVKELQEYLQQLKFILYRINFGIDEESAEELHQFLKKHHTSAVTLETMMTTAVMQPMQMSLKLEQIFDVFQMYIYQHSILNFSMKTWEGNYRILLKMADMYEKTGHEKYASECMERVPEAFLIWRRENQNLDCIQEYLWRFRYKDHEALQELVDFIKEGSITAEEWKALVQLEQIQAPEYYLMLAEAFLDQELTMYAVILLERANQIQCGNETVLCLLTEIAVKAGNVKEALDYLDQVEVPGALTAGFRKLCRNMQERESK